MIFITGMVRSGTTFATSVVENATGQRLAAQPLPLLYVRAMQAFHTLMKIESNGYPLSDCTFDHAYPREALVEFLGRFELSNEELKQILNLNSRYSGQQTRISLDLIGFEVPDSGGFAALVSKILQAAMFERKSGFAGSKETSCEEFIPYYAGLGWFVVLVIRDIRDVLCSLNLGQGRRYTGLPKPTLFNVRQWRKSVEFALACQSCPNVHVIRYEDLVENTESMRTQLVEMFRLWADRSEWRITKDPRGNEVRDLANTSFPGSKPGAPRYRGNLDSAFLRFVESLTWRELDVMNYERSFTDPPSMPTPGEFNDPFDSHREELSDYHWVEATYNQELERESILRGAPPSKASEGAFIFESVREMLASVSNPRTIGT